MGGRQRPAKIINTYQPAGKIEEFFQVLPNLKTCRRESRRLRKATPAEQIDGLKRVFAAHGMIVTGPPLDVNSNGK